MFTLRQASVKMAVLLHKQAKVPFVLSLAVYTHMNFKLGGNCFLITYQKMYVFVLVQLNRVLFS